MKMWRPLLAGLAALGAAFIGGCGEPTEAPLTTDRLAADQKAPAEKKPPKGADTFSQPKENPNARYKPQRGGGS